MRDALANLLDGLERAATHSDREGAAAALDAVNSFLLAINVDEPLRMPLFRLQAALADIEAGRGNKLLEPSKSLPHTAHRSAFDQQHYPLAAALVSLMVEKDRRQVNEACRYVGSRMGIEPAQLQSYRKNLTGRKLSGDELDTYVMWKRTYGNATSLPSLIERLRALKA